MYPMFGHTIDIWLAELDQYNDDQLCAKPSPGNWSLGQVYMHLISETNHFIKQAKIYASNNDHKNEEGSSAARQLFLRNDFPDELIEGPPSNARTPRIFGYCLKFPDSFKLTHLGELTGGK